ncbi:MAG: protein kinase [Gemmatimonadaceae bacterium]
MTLPLARDVPSLAPGITLAGRYVIQGVVGRGGSATVYRASDEKHGRVVALKVLLPQLSAAIGPDRFLQEIRIAAQLTHPHILGLIDSGEADGAIFYVMPFVTEGSLAERLRAQGPLPIAQVRRIVRELASALDYAHQNGYIHRDVKPQNILFTDGHAVLADFGVARVCGQALGQGLSTGGLVVGTPEYMSPEQASGDPELGGASDLYSLACVTYEMLTGVPPLRGDNPQATLAKHVVELPRLARTLRPDVPVEMDRAVARALAKSPTERFASVHAFSDALSDAGSETSLPLDGSQSLSIAVLPFVNASSDPENEYLSDGLTDELIGALAKVDGLRVASRTSVFALKGRAQDVRAVGALLGATWVIEGSVRRAGDRLRLSIQLVAVSDGRVLWAEVYDRAFQDVLAVQEEIARTVVDTLRSTSLVGLTSHARRRYTESVDAYGLYLRGRFAWNTRTAAGVHQAISFFEQAIAIDPKYALAYTGLADSYALSLDYKSVPVDEGFREAKAFARKALAMDDTLAEGHASLAWSLFIHDWEWDAAEREFRRAIELDPQYATAHQWYAMLLSARERSEESLIEAYTAMDLDNSSASMRRTAAFAHFYSRRFEQSRYHLLRAIAMTPVAEENYRMLGLVLAHMGQCDEAIRVLRRATAMPTAGSYDSATLGYALARAGERDEARQILADLTAQRETQYVSPVAFALVHLGLGAWDLAMHEAVQAVEQRRGWVAFLKVNPVFDPLRDHPQFADLVRRVGV